MIYWSLNVHVHIVMPIHGARVFSQHLWYLGRYRNFTLVLNFFFFQESPKYRGLIQETFPSGTLIPFSLLKALRQDLTRHCSGVEYICVEIYQQLSEEIHRYQGIQGGGSFQRPDQIQTKDTGQAGCCHSVIDALL